MNIAVKAQRALPKYSLKPRRCDKLLIKYPHKEHINVTANAIISALYKKANPADPNEQAIPFNQSGYIGIVCCNFFIRRS